MKRHSFTILFFLLFSSRNINAQLPVPDHVIVVVEENYAFGDIFGSADAPYLNSLIGQPNVALLTSSYALTHPSQPNYMMMFFGTNNGVTSDSAPLNRPWSLCNLGSSLIQSGRTFGGYSEDLPYVGFLGDTLGHYASKHCPWVNCQGTGINQLPDSTNMPFTSFPASNNYSSLPTVSFVIPNLIHDMHDPWGVPATAIPAGDAWFNTNLGSLVSWVKTNNSLLIVTFDEDDGVTNNIFTLFIGEMVQSGTYTNYINHYGLLRTLEDMYGLPHCGNSATANPITSCWLPIGINEISNKNMLMVYPNPSVEKFNVQVQASYSEKAAVSLTDQFGRIIKTEEFNIDPGNNVLSISTDNILDGIYLMHLKGEHVNLCKKVVVKN